MKKIWISFLILGAFGYNFGYADTAEKKTRFENESGTISEPFDQLIFPDANIADNLDGTGNIAFSTASDFDHGEFQGLGDDDHLQYHNDTRADLLYIRQDGTKTYSATGAGFKDEDDMASDSAVATASQQSIKKYVDDLAAPLSATYITQTSNATLTAEQALSSLSTGIMKVTTTTGVVSSITDSSGNWDTAYTHSQDNTQAHSDYLLNSGDTLTGNLLVDALVTIDGRDLSVDGAKLDDIESNATADQTAGEIEAIVNHDNLLGFVGNEHLDWTLSSQGTIHTTNYVDNDTTDHTLFSNIGTNTHTQLDSHLTDNTQAHTDYLLNNAADTGVALTLEGATSVPLILDNQTGTQNIFEVKDNGTAVFTIDDGGMIGIGKAPTATNLIDVEHTFSSGMFTRGLQINAIVDDSAVTNLQAFAANARAQHTSGTVTNLFGFEGGTIIDAAGGTTTNAIGLNARIVGTNSISATVGTAIAIRSAMDMEDLTVTEAIGFQAGNIFLDTGSLDRAIGFHAKNQTNGTANWSILSEGDIQIISDKQFILEGSSTVKGDTYLVYDSTGTTLDFFINGTEILNMSSSLAKFEQDVEIASAKNIILNTTTGTKIGTATTQLLGFWNATPVNQPDALTAQDTSITHTAPGTADYALQDLISFGSYGFATKDEGNTVLQVIANLQARMAEIESRLEEIGLVTSN